MKEFNRILVARYSPDNRCHGPVGAWLVPATNLDKARFRIAKDSHYFVSLETRTPNFFGWVTELREPITAESLQEADRQHWMRFGGGTPVEVPDLTWYEDYLRSVARQPAGTPMACGFRDVKVPGALRRTMFVHKVILHRD